MESTRGDSRDSLYTDVIKKGEDYSDDFLGSSRLCGRRRASGENAEALSCSFVVDFSKLQCIRLILWPLRKSYF